MESPNNTVDGFSLVDIATVALQRRRMLVAIPASLILGLLVIGLLQPRTYTVTTRFMPQEVDRSISSVSGLAAQFGIIVPAGDAGQSLEFYAALVKSDQLLRSLVTTEYQFPVRGTVTLATLVAVYEIDKDTEGLARAAAVERLRSNYQVSIDIKSGLVTLRVITRNPGLAVLVAQRALALVNEFNLDTRQSQAKQERLFVQDRLMELESELRMAEDSLEAFLLRNRQFRGAPDLVFQHERLQRRVLMRQQVFTSLSQSYEQARIDEVRNTPIITTFEEPVLPVEPDSRRLLVRGLIGLVVGVLAALLMAFGFEIFDQGRRQAPEQADRLSRLREEAMKDIRRPWRVFRTGEDPGG